MNTDLLIINWDSKKVYLSGYYGTFTKLDCKIL